MRVFLSAPDALVEQRDDRFLLLLCLTLALATQGLWD